jgi:ADP-ribose pyrophosphatase
MKDRLTEQPLQKQLIHKGKFLEYHLDHVQLPNGRTSTREYLHHPGAVAAVPLLPDGRIVMVRQFRYPIGQALLEIPAGKLDSGEEPLDCVRRELSEEIGFEPQTIIHLISIWTTPGFTDEIIHLYLAKDLIPLQREPDLDEFVEAVSMTRDEIFAWLDSAQVVDSKTALALSYIERHRLW